MGFFDDLLARAADAQRERLQKLPINQLISEWEETFKYREFTPNNLYKDNTVDALLDDLYHRRTTRPNWKMKYEDYMKEQRQKEEEARQKENFRQALPNNDMVKDIIQKINEIGYDAFYIEVDDETIVCRDSNERKIATYRYKKYGYPNLNYEYCRILRSYLSENLKLNYENNGDYELELNDSPNGMKSSW